MRKAYVCQLPAEEQEIVRLVITGYVHTFLYEYTEEEKKEVIEDAMNERLCNICDADIAADLLRGVGII